METRIRLQWTHATKGKSGASPSQTPLLGDGVAWIGWPQAGDKLPDNFHRPVRETIGWVGGNGDRETGDMAQWCLERHGKGINMLMVDASVQRFRAPQLWTLHWSETFQEERANLLQNGGQP